MSEEESTNNHGEDSSASMEMSAALTTTRELLSSMQSAKDEFDSLVSALTAQVQHQTDSASVALSEVISLRDSVQSVRSDIDARQNEINEILNRANRHSTELEELKTSVAASKGAIDTAQVSVSEILGVVTQSKADVDALKSALSERSKEISDEHEKVATEIESLQELQTSLQNILTELTELKGAAEADVASIQSDASKIAEDREAFENLSSSAQEKYASLAAEQDSLQSKIEEVNQAHGSIVDLRRRLLDGTGEEKSVQLEVDELRSSIEEILASVEHERDVAISALAEVIEDARQNNERFSKEMNQSFGGLYNSLQDRILSLLPSAGAAGLASTYYDAKSRYSPTSYAGKPGTVEFTGWRRFLRRIVGNNPASVVATGFFYAMFICPLIVLAYGTYELVLQLEAGTLTFDYRILALRFLVVLPLATISAFGFSSLPLYRHLYEEYNHKQRVMELYRSFREEIEKGGDKEQIKALLNIMLSSVSSKAGETSRDEVEPMGSREVVANLNQLTNVLQRLKSAFG